MHFNCGQPGCLGYLGTCVVTAVAAICPAASVSTVGFYLELRIIIRCLSVDRLSISGNDVHRLGGLYKSIEFGVGSQVLLRCVGAFLCYPSAT
jgi:hypothetical protein